VSRQRALQGLVLATALALAGCASTTGDQTEVRRLQARAAYERGLSHLDKREAAPALTAIQEAISIDATVPVYWNALGWLYLQLARPEVAHAAFTKATGLDETYAEAHLNTGVALAELGRWEEALAAYRKALSLPTLSTPHTAYQNIGVALYNLKRYRDAEEALKFALGLEPKLAPAYYHLGLVLVAGGRREEAKALFRHARDLAPGSPFGQAAVGQLKALGEGG
jgi:Tfp pilus assembly protein PilF